MINNVELICKECGDRLKYFDKVKRIIRTKNRKTKWITIKRYKCKNCQKIHRILPDNLLPFKQYEKEVIMGVKDGIITSDTYGFEDYPCEMTMKRWLKDLNK